MGNLPGGSVRSKIYFVKLDLSDIIVQALPSAQLTLTNSIARTLGLHDFYQVGLWNFCEGYKDRYEHFPHFEIPTFKLTSYLVEFPTARIRRDPSGLTLLTFF